MRTVRTSKTTKQNIAQLMNVLRHIKRAKAFIDRDETFVCSKSRGSTTIEYYNARENVFITPINKQVGSDLCGLSFAEDALKRFIDNAS